MKKSIKAAVAAIMGICFSLLATGCGFFPVKSIVSVEKTATNGLVDTYTISYSDGSVSTFEITNGANGENGQNGQNGEDGKDGQDGQDGENGKDGKDVSVREFYEEYVKEYGEISYSDFLALYFSLDRDEVSTLHECLLSTAKVYCEFMEMDSGTYTPKLTGSTGAAVIYKIEGNDVYFLTNYHVVFNSAAIGSKISERVYCYLYGSEGHPTKLTETNTGKEYYEYEEFAIPCEYIGGAASYDIALLKADASVVLAINPQVRAVELAQAHCVGESAFAVGNPKDRGMSVTKGVVSVENDIIQLSIGGKTRNHYSFRMDVPLYKGNSGGGVFNSKGKLIGLAHAADTESQNINYAIPVSLLKAGAENALYYYKSGKVNALGIYKPTLGVTMRAQNPKYIYNEATGYGQESEEILVIETAKESVVQLLGLKAGDILTSISVNGKDIPLTRISQLGEVLLTAVENTEIAFSYLRSGEKKTTENYRLQAKDIKIVE
jgi:S1-C subfamily serine protease